MRRRCSTIGRIAVLAVLVLSASGCGGSAIAPKGDGASSIALALWIMLGVLVPLYLVVVGLVVASLVWRRPWIRGLTRGHRLLYGTGIVLPLALALGFFAIDLATGRSYAADDGARPDIVVRGHLWWWEVEYPREGITIANEMRIPVGRDVTVELHSDNVIHSIWVPALQGKMDLIPGTTNTVTLHADTPGVYRGQCAEFCGLQHGKMAFMVVAYDQTAYRRWIANRTRSEPPGAGGALPAGLGVVLGAGCRWCHTIDGTAADGRVGPDLTHIADRLTLGAGSVANTRANLARWISDPASIKPGAKMPAFAGTLSPRELAAVVAYLQELR